MERPLALVVDRDPAVRAIVREVLEENGLLALGATTAAEALDLLRTRPLRLLMVDLDAPGVGSAGLLDAARRLRPTAAVVVLGDDSDGARQRVLSEVERGAFDALLKPLDEMDLRLLVRRATSQSEILEERQRLRDELRGRFGYQRLIGRSEAMERLRERLERVARGRGNVMFVGEDGTGRELAARTLQAMSDLRDWPFLALDCRALAPAAIEAELFAAARGADDAAAPAGRVVFLDDVLELPEQIQVRLAEVLAPGRGVAEMRVLSATAGDPAGAAERGRFREDLLAALASTTIELPPLRQRKEDIPLLSRHFVETIREINNLPPIQLAPETLSVLASHTWPGNVRELRNAVEQAVILAVDGTIRPRDLPEKVRQRSEAPGDEAPRPPLSDRVFKEAKREVVEAFERRYLQDVLERYRGNVTAAAQHAGMLRSALQRLLRKYKIRSVEFRRRRKPSSG